MELITIISLLGAFLLFVSKAPSTKQNFDHSSGYPSKEEWDSRVEANKRRALEIQQGKVDLVRRKVQSGLKQGRTSFSFSYIFNNGAGDGDRSKARAAQVVRKELEDQGITGVRIYDDWWPDMM